MFRKRNAVLNVRIPLDGPCYADAQLACLLSARLQATTAGYSPFSCGDVRPRNTWYRRRLDFAAEDAHIGPLKRIWQSA